MNLKAQHKNIPELQNFQKYFPEWSDIFYFGLEFRNFLLTRARLYPSKMLGI